MALGWEDGGSRVTGESPTDVRTLMGIETATVVSAPREEVFAWHARPGALRRLLPPWAHLSVESEATSLVDGTAVIALPAGVRWTSTHDPAGYQEGRRFVDAGDLPLTGSRVSWRDEHLFEDASAGRTRVVDIVETPIPGLTLRPALAYRYRQLAGDLAIAAELRDFAPDPLTIGMTGSSGLVGDALAAMLTTAGHTVIRLVRTPQRDPHTRVWDPADPAPDLAAGLDALVHLAGAPIAGRFTDSHRRAVHDSRVGPTARLARVAGDIPVISASAIGLYGYDRGDEALEESATRGDGFLADVVAGWEADAAQAAGRHVCVRTGIVQSAAGGALALQRPLFAAGLGGPLAGGQQWLSWIALDDLLDIYYRAIVDERLSGPVNAVAPHPRRQRDWADTLGAVLHRPTRLPTPSFGPRLLLGQDGAKEVAEASQRVVPARLAQVGHRFRFANLEDALRHELGKTTDDTLARTPA